MIKKTLAPVLLMAASLAGAAQPSEKEAKALMRDVRRVDAELKRDVGLSIRETSLLLHESSTTYQPKWVLERSGDLKLLQRMETKGFIRLHVQKGLPDGRQSEEEFVSYEATDRGLLIMAVL